MKPQSTLLACSSTVDGITGLVNRYWYSTEYSVNPDTLAIEHARKPVPEGFRVILKRGRYRFEHLSLESVQ